MKPPWYQPAVDADLEALQTDVMRFMAILGLCLAAIFSLVQNSTETDNTPETSAPQPVAAPLAQASESMPAVSALGTANAKAALVRALTPTLSPTPAQATTEAPAPSRRNPGFSLEFASGDALLRLLESGQISLFARVDGKFWVLDSGSGTFAATVVPVSYYGMLAATVPPALRRSLSRAIATPGAKWGVQLTPGMVDRLQRIMRERAGGNLLIQADGSIRVELAENQARAHTIK